MNSRYLMLSATAAISLLLTGADAQAQRGLKGNSFDELMQRAQNMLADVRELKCFRSGAEEMQYYEEFNALKDAITELMKTTYPRVRHEPLDPHIDRLDTVADKILRNLIDTPKCVPPAPQQGMTPSPPPAPPAPPPPPPTPKADTASEHSSTGGQALGGELAGLYANDWTVLANYQHFDPKTGDSGNQWGLGGAGLMQVADGIAINYTGGYNGVSTAHTNLDNWYANGAAVWEQSNLRFGPTVGYQSNSEAHYHADTWNYGGFVDYYHSPDITFGAKAGGFSTSTDSMNSSGYYLGGSVTGYWNPNLSTTGSIDYTHFSPFGGSSETDYGLHIGWRPCPTTPFSVWGGYTYSTFGPGSFTLNTISVGVNWDLGNLPTLRDSDRSGTLTTQTTFAATSLKF
jgi:hypothetical protein